MRAFSFFPAIFVFLFLFVPITHAQELIQDQHTTMKARIIQIISEEHIQDPALDLPEDKQILKIEIVSGAEKGTIVEIENNSYPMREDQLVYLTHTTNSVDPGYYWIQSPYRIPQILALLFLFIAVVVLFGGKQGVRGLLALIASFFFIGAFLLPGIMKGYSPVVVSVFVASCIVLIGSYLTHGFNRTTTAAVIGMIGTILFTGALAFASIYYFQLTGWSSDEVTYLNLNSGGSLDLGGLLLGGILIGLLGVLYDAAIGQAVSVEELASAGTHLSRKDVYLRALRIGREHVGALVNTLAIAYAGASLPLLLLFYGDPNLMFGPTISQEIFSTEIVRILVGSIGLVLAVPVTTAVAVRMLVKTR